MSIVFTQQRANMDNLEKGAKFAKLKNIKKVMNVGAIRRRMEDAKRGIVKGKTKGGRLL